MNELYRTIEAAFAAAPEGDARELLGKALDMLDTIPMEPLEIMAKVRKVKSRLRTEKALLKWKNPKELTDMFHAGWRKGLAYTLKILDGEFPDA